MSETEIATFTSQILNGLVHLHSCGIIHLDLKPQNVVLTDDNKVAKICDMDSSRKMSTEITRQSDVSKTVETMHFMSSEMLEFREDGPTIHRETDIWSVSCIVLYMFDMGDFFVKDKDGVSVSVKRCTKVTNS